MAIQHDLQLKSSKKMIQTSDVAITHESTMLGTRLNHHQWHWIMWKQNTMKWGVTTVFSLIIVHTGAQSCGINYEDVLVYMQRVITRWLLNAMSLSYIILWYEFYLYKLSTLMFFIQAKVELCSEMNMFNMCSWSFLIMCKTESGQLYGSLNFAHLVALTMIMSRNMSLEGF